MLRIKNLNVKEQSYYKQRKEEPAKVWFYHSLFYKNYTLLRMLAQQITIRYNRLLGMGL